MRGHRLALLTIIPLSMEKVSIGRPATCQLRIFTGSPSVAINENTFEHGICCFEQRDCQSLTHTFNIPFDKLACSQNSTQ